MVRQLLTAALVGDRLDGSLLGLAELLHGLGSPGQLPGELLDVVGHGQRGDRPSPQPLRLGDLLPRLGGPGVQVGERLLVSLMRSRRRSRTLTRLSASSTATSSTSTSAPAPVPTRTARPGRLAARAGRPVAELFVDAEVQQRRAGLTVGPLLWRKRAKSPWGRTTHVLNCPKPSPRSSPTAVVMGPGVGGEHLVAALRGGPPSLVVAPVAVARTTWTAVYSRSPTVKSSRTFVLGEALADDVPHDLCVVVAGHSPVEGEGDRVDQAGLARAGGAGEGEQIGPLEVHFGGLTKGGEPFELEPLRPHR